MKCVQQQPSHRGQKEELGIPAISAEQQVAKRLAVARLTTAVSYVAAACSPLSNVYSTQTIIELGP
jgi:hypothetical protein